MYTLPTLIALVLLGVKNTPYTYDLLAPGVLKDLNLLMYYKRILKVTYGYICI